MLFSRFLRRFGPHAFISYGIDGMSVVLERQEPAIQLMILEADEAYNVAREILRRHSNGNATRKAFWNAVHSNDPSELPFYINGTRLIVSDRQVRRRICDLFLLSASCDSDSRAVEIFKRIAA